MNRFGWTLAVPNAEQAAIMEQLRPRICYHLNLCAAIGCSCTIGGDAAPLCFETQAGRRYPMLHSEGPTWAIFIRCLADHIIIDCNTDGPTVQWELRELYREFCSWGYPIFVHHTAVEQL